MRVEAKVQTSQQTLELRWNGVKDLSETHKLVFETIYTQTTEEERKAPLVVVIYTFPKG